MHRHSLAIIIPVILIHLAGCSSSPMISSFQLDPGQRGVLALSPTTQEILLTNRGPGTVEMDLEDNRLRVLLAMTLRPGDRHTSREISLARIRFANQSSNSSTIEFRIWGDEEGGFALDLNPPPLHDPIRDDAE